MIIRILLLLFVAAATASALSEENVSQSLDGAPGGKLIVDVDFGTIDVSAGANDKITLAAHRKIDSDNEAQEKEYLTSAPVIVSKEGNTVTIRARRQNKERNLNWSGRCSMDARYTVQVPRSFNSELRTGGGTIIVAELTGSMSADTSGGRLAFENINGKIFGRTSGGSISAKLKSPVPGDVNLETSAGSIDVMVPPDAGLDIEAEASSGRVISELPFIGTRTDRDTMKGKINGGGKSLVLRSGAGSISIKPASAEMAAR